jgi:predicted alpha/beta-fold hydrolase
VEVERRRWETADGDFVDLDILPAPPEAPRVLVLHGLEGSSRAGYIAEVFRQAQQRGWQAIGLNFRSCSGEPNRLAASYHSGSTADVSFVAHRLRQAGPGPLTAIGFSLGGNILLRLLGETGDAAPVDAAVAISAPFDLQECAHALDHRGSWFRVYRHHFLRSLRKKALEKSRRFPQLPDRRAIRSISGIEAFDELVTAPLNGFASAAHYYAQCSSGPILHRICRPTLLLNAKDDPLAPTPVPFEALANPNLSVVATEKGGHVGFVSGTLFRPRYWAEQQALDFLSRYTASS